MEEGSTLNNIAGNNTELKNSRKKYYNNNFHAVETVAYALMICFAACSIYYIYHFHPVIYTKLITEDQWGEYCTSVNYGLSGTLLILLLFRPGQRLKKVMWATIGLGAIFIAFEEISWGQRIFNFPTPNFLAQLNRQGEFTFHNLNAVYFSGKHLVAGIVVFGWSIFSVVVSIRFPLLKNRIKAIGLPLIPARLVLIFLLVAFFFIFQPVAKSDEIGELLLSIGVAAWAFNLFFQYGWFKHPTGIPAVCAMAGMMFLVASVAAGLTYQFPSSTGRIKWRLNTMAARDYPTFGMYSQAQSLYEYIYLHPQYISPETKINHGRMLLKVGDKYKAFSILSEVVSELEACDVPEDRESECLRRFGITLMLLGQNERANAKFSQAIEMDMQRLESISQPKSKAKLLFSIAKTLEVHGDVAASLDMAKEARAKATTALLKRKIDKFIETLTKVSEDVSTQVPLEEWYTKP